MTIKNIWILTSPDNENYDKDFALEEVQSQAQIWDLKITPTFNTRDQGAGQEQEFVVEGSEKDIEGFLQALQENLY